MWDLIVSVPDHCLSFCFASLISNMLENCKIIIIIIINKIKQYLPQSKVTFSYCDTPRIRSMKGILISGCP